MDVLLEYLPLLIPLILIQVGLMVAALWDLFRQPLTRGPRWLWIVIIVFVNIVGPILYFTVGREEA
ncbi:MAG: PLDc N-terminal domain-containing protein [Anaerolineae bacterium]|nr:PLDc N-terminal domain-containing protein [Anaerolineae bacterium]